MEKDKDIIEVIIDEQPTNNKKIKFAYWDNLAKDLSPLFIKISSAVCIVIVLGVFFVGFFIPKNDNKITKRLEKLTFPVFVKPANMGSSVGISKAENESELRSAIDLALKYDSRILIEQGVVAREIEVGILGNTTVKTTDPGEVVKDVAFYDYQAKYIDNKITMDIPARVPVEVMTQMRAYAAKAFRALGGCGLARCDFFLTEDGAIYLNELNTMPGFTQWSMYPLLWENMGLSYSDLIKELVVLGQEMFDKRESHLI